MSKVVYLNSKWNGEDSLTVFDVANAFLSFKSLTNLQIQKLCYYAQSWYYTLNDEPLFPEHFEAWIHGPVCPELYHRYKLYGGLSIPRNEMPGNIKSDKYLHDFIENIFEEYGSLSGKDLELLTHNEDPWKIARGDLNSWEPSYKEISLDSMKEYYLKLLED
jgi:uncharacterized phage-associated protein